MTGFQAHIISSFVLTYFSRKSMQMHKVLLPFFLALVVTPSTHSLEGTLLVCQKFTSKPAIFMILSYLVVAEKLKEEQGDKL